MPLLGSVSAMEIGDESGPTIVFPEASFAEIDSVSVRAVPSTGGTQVLCAALNAEPSVWTPDGGVATLAAVVTPPRTSGVVTVVVPVGFTATVRVPVESSAPLLS